MGTFPNKDTQFKPGNPGGGKPKGTIHLSTHIQNLLNDENFEANILDAKTGIKEYKGAPVKAIIAVAVTRAVNGDDKAREWLAKYGYGQKFELEHSGEVATGVANPELATEFAQFLKDKHA